MSHSRAGGASSCGAGILLKLYSKIGQVAESEDGSYKGLHMPMDESKKESKGFAFIEFVDKKAAANAVEQTGACHIDHTQRGDT